MSAESIPADQEHAPRRLREGFPGQRLVVVPARIVRRSLRQPVTRDLCVTHIGRFAAARGHYVRRSRGTPQFVLFFCLSGAGSCTLGRRTFPMGAGDLVVLPPRQAHLYSADDRTPWTIFWVHFEGGRAADYVKCLGATPENPVVSVDSPATMFEAFEDTFRHATHGFSDAAMMALGTAFARLLGLAVTHRRSPGLRARRAEARLLKALAVIRDRPGHSWSVAEMAREAGMSVPHFSTLFRHQTGLPPMTFLIGLRMQRAMDLLQRGQHNVSEAARAVGYEDAFYFSRLFHRHLGVPPSSCRYGP